MLRQEQIDEWVDRYGEWVYHWVMFDRDIPWILRDGLLERRATGQLTFHRNLMSSPDHIYLLVGTGPTIMGSLGNPSAVPQFKIRIRDLRRQLIETDEDTIGVHEYDRTDGRPSPLRTDVEHLPFASHLREWPTSSSEVHPWMERWKEIVSSPEWVWHSALHGRVNYFGRIPRELVHIHDHQAVDRWRPADPGDPWKPWTTTDPPKYENP